MTPLSYTESTDKTAAVEQRAAASAAPAATSEVRARFGGLRMVFAIAGKDLRTEIRTKETINAALAFAVVILVMFSLAFDPSSDQVREIAGGLLWLVFMFAGALVLNRSFSRELTNDCLDALIASPATGAQLWAGKALANYVLLLAIEVVCLPVFGIFYNLTWLGQLPMLALVLLLATWAMTIIGTTFSAMTVNLRLREIMLPTLLYPMLIPPVMGAVQLTSTIIAGEPIGDSAIWFRLLIGYDIIFTLLSAALVEILLVG
jgi:heme exporter protein B